MKSQTQRRIERIALVLLLVTWLVESAIIEVQHRQINRLFDLIEQWRELYERRLRGVS